jgi:GGDEF domain-containing protein
MSELERITSLWTQLHDPVSGLPSSALFYDRVRQAMLIARREGLTPVLMLMSIDVLEGEGGRELDPGRRHELTNEVADRLITGIRSSDSAGRVGQGTFGVLLPHSMDEGVALVAGRLMVSMLRPLGIPHSMVLVRTSVGVAVAGESGPIDEASLFAQAGEALSIAESKGGGFEAYASAESQEWLDQARGAA